ncbi:hypothetical protein CBR_g3797 [Chara braunii]|uniref:Uncharacterized protein n=1 Tax=Chara braunii TaxID=69332 RepID=A0A388KGD6_CHABU|nr:hypothetical protein CBR_g3797 [Chara braunii]|eukprot:GBG69099.1 hypothetical protein CBR_g3797 [Chara braunii]
MLERRATLPQMSVHLTRKKDCGNGPIKVDHAIWYLLAHPDVLFPNVASVKVKISMFIHFFKVSWKEAIEACVTFTFIREAMTDVISAIERDPSLTAEIAVDRTKWKYNTPLTIGRVLLPTRVTGNPRVRARSSPGDEANKRQCGKPPLVISPRQRVLPFALDPRQQMPQAMDPPPQPPSQSTAARRGAVQDPPPQLQHAQDEGFEQEEGCLMIQLPSGRLAWRKAKKEKREFVHIRYSSRLMEGVLLRRFVIEGLGQVMGEKSKNWLDEVVIGWKYDEPIAAKICKPGRVFRKFKLAEWEVSYNPNSCTCGAGRHAVFLNPAAIRLLPTERVMHIITTDTGVMNNGQLQLMMNAGLNNIPMRALDEEFALCEIEEALSHILTTRVCDEELSMKEEKIVKNYVMEKARTAIR